MGTGILVGIPSGHVGAAKTAISNNAALFQDWSIKYVPSNGKEPEILPRTINQAQEMAARYDDVHLFGFSAQKNRNDLVRQIKPYFRFRWFPNELLRCLGSPDPSPFVQQLATDLQEEKEWAERVKPSNLDSPLLLPECSFRAAPKHRELWRHANAYGNLENVAGAEKAIRGFRGAHHRKITLKKFTTYKWVDEGNRIFDQDGPRHGIAPFPRNWKFSYQIEPGFHFDVTHTDERQFDLFDVNGIRCHVEASAHLNIDPHGYVRR
jgi:hypothetical protein